MGPQNKIRDFTISITFITLIFCIFLQFLLGRKLSLGTWCKAGVQAAPVVRQREDWESTARAT